ncbi:unnamed protein product [Adineta ricciae]|uniref:Uncharacterized protein n=1 Tax=Adineta ricciae TaxID=249248 RepID=A0A815UA45_ADIRI|nr:unnamed protein product [Adineta ricciae]CAF1519661.1 unnamed protein product [Adineta ricciae]
MATITRTRRREVTATADDEPRNSSPDFRNTVHAVGTGMRDITRTAAEVLGEFQDALKPLMSEFSAEEQNQIYNAFLEYHELLTTSQRFLTRALILAARARTSTELMASIDIQMIRDMCSTVGALLEKFMKINPILQEKLKDQQALKRLRNILGLFALISGCSIGIGAAVARFTSVGFTTGMKAYLVVAGSVTVATAAPAVMAHVAQHEAELNHLKSTLVEMRGVLTTLSQNYPKIEVTAQILSDDDHSRQDFIQLLKDTQAEVDKGFAILRNL